VERSPPSDEPSASGAARRGCAALAAALAVGVLVRLLPYPTFFTPGGVLLAADGDTYYHALRAERIARAWPRVPWVDPGMNHPYGAEVPWPPLLDEIVATGAVLTGPATSDHVAAVAALVPVVLGVAGVAAAWALAVALTGGSGWGAALLVALLPAAVRQGFVGRADHHVLETLLSALAFLLFARGLRRPPSWARSLLLGAVLALSFWSWAGSALYLLVLSAALAAMHLLLPPGDPAPGRVAGELARGASVAAVLLAVSVAWLGPPGALASGRLTPISGLAGALALLTGGAAAIVAAARRLDGAAGPPGRAAHLAAAAVLPALGLLAVPPLREGVAHAAAAVGAASLWYQTIPEFWPLLFSGHQPWTRELLLALFAFGLAPLALPAAALLLRRAWVEDPGRRASLVFLAVWTVSMFGLALVRRRFEGYAVLPLAVCAAWAAREAGARLAARLGRERLAPALALGFVLLAAAPGLPVSLTGAVGELPDGAADKFPLLEWLRTVPTQPGREAVLSGWGQGHEIQWLARRPVVSTPFGSDIDPRSLLDEAAFITAREPAAARALLDRRRVGFLLLENPVHEVATVGRLAPGAPELVVEELGVSTGTRWALHPDFFDLVVSRLFFFDGGSPRGEPGLASYRLVAESRAPTEVLGLRAQRYKLFQVVDGAVLRVRGVAEGALVNASVEVRTNAGRGFTWSAAARADESGAASIRVPYATGANGLVLAGPCTVGDGARAVSIVVAEAAVAAGAEVAVTWAGPGAARGRASP
jgi:dolichyl-diphosphooligosaccharide--protein glycosyltransferase